MPLDQRAPAPSSRHADRLARLKILRRKANSEQRKKRRWLKNQLFTANLLLAEIIDGGDVIAENVISADAIEPYVCLLVTISAYQFKQLCDYGAELEDIEDSHDAERDNERQPSLMAATGSDLDGWDSRADDREVDVCDLGEPKDYRKAADQPIIDAARERYKRGDCTKIRAPLAFTATDPETRRVGRWIAVRGGLR